MQALSTLSAMSENPEFYPEIISQDLSASSASFVLRIPHQLAFFNGHFDQFQILPGVVQVDWVYSFARIVFNLSVPSEVCIPNVKFSYPIYPDSTICLNLNHDSKKNRLSFRYEKNRKACSSGILEF